MPEAETAHKSGRVSFSIGDTSHFDAGARPERENARSAAKVAARNCTENGHLYRSPLRAAIDAGPIAALFTSQGAFLAILTAKIPRLNSCMVLALPETLVSNDVTKNGERRFGI